MVLVSDVLEHIGWINSPLSLANKKIQKLKFVRNTAPDNQSVLNFMYDPDWRIFLLVFHPHLLLDSIKQFYSGK